MHISQTVGMECKRLLGKSPKNISFHFFQNTDLLIFIRKKSVQVSFYVPIADQVFIL